MCKILYEDNHLLVVEKPPGMLIQGDRTGDDCLVECMKRYIGQKYRKPGTVFLGLVHRMDRPVGGLVAIARTSKAAARLSEQLREHTMEREYLAVVHGGSMPDTGRLTDILTLDTKSGNMRVVAPDFGDPFAFGGLEADKNSKHSKYPPRQQAILRFTVLLRDQIKSRTLVHVQLETGRKHQIRIQLAHMGHPIVQDMRYGHGEAGEHIALWGAAIRLIHPTLRKSMVFASRPRGNAFERFGREIDAFLTRLTQE